MTLPLFSDSDKIDRIRELITKVVNSDATPLHSHNDVNRCDWCLIEWKKPSWKLTVFPEYFGHPVNDCLIWEGKRGTR